MYSDVHSPLVATLQFNEKAAGHDQFQSSDHTIHGRIKKWDNTKCLTFQDNVDKENLNGLYNELTNSISENITKDNINASVKKLCDIFVDSAQTTFGTYKNKRKNLNRKPKGDKPWFNYECKFARKNYRKLKRKFKKERTETLKQNVTEAEKHYKNTLDKNSKNYRKKMREELKNLKTSDPKEYWKILNRGREKKQPDIPMEDLFNF